MLSIPILQTIAHSNRWTTCTVPSESDTGGTVRPLLLFTDHRHPGTLRLAFDGDAAILLSLDPPRDLAAAFPGWSIAPETNSLRLPIDPPKGGDLLLRLPAVFTTLADLASGILAVVPISPPETPPATDREQLILARTGQGIYRDRLLALWGNACAVTGLANPDFLRASHAKPWKDSTDAERLDPANGLPLVPNLDHLFDGGWISFSDTGAILLSPSLVPAQAAFLGVTTSLRLRQPLSPAQKSYLSYHRTHVFRIPSPPPPPPPLPPQRPPRPARPSQPPPQAAPASVSRPPPSFLADFRSGDPFQPFARVAAHALPDDDLPEAWTDLPDGHGGTATTAILASIPGKWALVRPEDYPDAAPLVRRGWRLFSTDASPEAFADFLRNLQPRTRP